MVLIEEISRTAKVAGYGSVDFRVTGEGNV
jgi:hypothetical protein